MVPERQNKNEGKFSDVPVRVRSWIVIIIILLVSLIHPVLSWLFVSALSFGGMKEYFSLTGIGDKKWLFVSYASVIFLYYYAYNGNYSLFAGSVPGYALFLGLLYVFFSKERQKLKQGLDIFKGIILNVFAIGHLAFILNLNAIYLSISGIKAFLFLVILTELNDVFQYLTGKFFGKRKIVPRISPNKTTEGFLGGVVLTTCLANGLGPFLLPGRSFVLYSFLGLLISLLGFCGDVYMSSVKRTAGVKNTGTLIPGHGGLLDRIDSLIFITPVYYWIIRFLVLEGRFC